MEMEHAYRPINNVQNSEVLGPYPSHITRPTMIYDTMLIATVSVALL